MRVALYGVGASAMTWPFQVQPGGPPTTPGVYVFDTQHMLPADRVGFDVVLHVVSARRPKGAAALPSAEAVPFMGTVFAPPRGVL